MSTTTNHRWIQISLFNLTIVALVGLVMRYKIGFSFPYFTQKYLQHAHSHFAFSGWVSHVLFVLLFAFLQRQVAGLADRRYHWLIGIQLVCAYGMLVAFAAQGYAAVSIAFSTLSVLVGYVYLVMFWRDTAAVATSSPAVRWFRAALVFNALSSIGTFYLAYMMATKQIVQDHYLSSVYFYLHFQYNGWFLMACMGLLSDYLRQHFSDFREDGRIFWALAGACVPAFGLSVLWLSLPMWLLVLIAVSAAAQLYGFGLLVRQLYARSAALSAQLPTVVRWVLLTAGLALGVKLLLQMGSVVPAVSHLAFGFRNIVIAYLHLVLLMFTTLFLLGYLYAAGWVRWHPAQVRALGLFAMGVVVNELLLGVQGIASITYFLVPYMHHALVGVSLFLLAASVAMSVGALRR